MKSKLTKLFTLLAVLIFGISNVWGAETVLFGSFSNTTASNYFKSYTVDAKTVTVATDRSISSSSGDYFVQLGSTPSNNASNYIELSVSGATIKTVSVLITGNGSDKTCQPALLGWEGAIASNTTADYVLVPASQVISNKGLSNAQWHQFDVHGNDLTKVRIYRAVKGVSVAGAAAQTYGNGQTLQFYGVRVELEATSTDPVSSVSVAGATTGYATVPVELTATTDKTATGYKWFVDGVEQDGKTSATFNFEAATPGTYSIVAKARNDYNTEGEWIASDAHTVTVSKLCGELIKIVQNGQNDGNVSGILTGTKDVKLSSGTSEYDEKTGRKIGSDNYWLGVKELSKPLRAGDVATIFVTTASAKLQLFSDKGTTLIGEMASGVVQGENEIVLNSSATGATAIYLYRTSTAGSDMNPFVHSLSVNRSCEASTDCSISDVTINSEAITPVGKVYSYEVAAASALTEVAVTYSIHPLATGTPASGFTVAVPTAGDPANTQTITVTAEDGTHSDTYTISVSKATAASDVVTLDALAVTGYTLSPVFDAATLAYTITKDYGTADPTTDKVTFTKSEEAQKVEVVYDGTNHKFVVTVTAEDNTHTQDYEITINEAEAKRGLLTVPFSNGAKGAINAAGLEIRVPYIGASEPTIDLAGIEYQSGVSGASASMEAGKLRITGEDSNYDDYTITFVQLTPSALTLDELVTFDAVPSYAFAPYGWDSGKGVKFAKNVEEASNHRVSLGNTRVYFAIQACDEVQLTSGSGDARNVKIYVNGVLSSVNKTAASGSAIKLALDNTQANFIAIESNQTGGDGGFTKILVKALADNTLAYTDGAYTTGEAALDLSTLISTSNSDGAITYAVKTDGGTNASIAGNNFTATVAGTATITATQVASETIRQKSVDFNVVVTAGATKYTVTFDAQGGSAVDPQEVTEGENPVVPTAPTKDEYIFQGWSETTDGAVVDVTSFTINAPKIFYAIWVAEPAGIKLLDGSTVNHTNFITGVTADETVEFMGNTVNYAKFSGTCGSVTNVKDLTKSIIYNATTNKTKIKISAHNNSTSGRNIYVIGLVEGASEAVSLANIALGNKEDKISDWIEFDNAANRTIYIMVPSSAGDVYITQVKVIESGETPMKQAGEAGYSLNFNKGRFFGVKDNTIAFEGLNVGIASSDCQPLNTSVVKLNNTSISFTVATPLTLTVTTNNNKTYYVTEGAAGTDNETAKTGATDFDLTAGTWYVTAGASNVEITNIAFALPKAEEPTITTQPATKLTFDPGDLTATVVAAEPTDGGTLSYQWYDASDDSEVDGATNATLTTTTEGTYYVIVTNSLAGHQDSSIKSDEATLAYRDASDATLSALSVSEGTLDPTFDPAELNYRVDLPEGTVDVPTLTATATMAGYANVAINNATAFVNYEAVSTVTVTSEDLSDTKVYTVHFYVDHAIATLVDVTDDITWDFSKANDGTAATSGLCNEEIFANVAGIVNNGDFESDNLIVTANKFASGKLQASMIKFHTTVDGLIKVIFSDTGSSGERDYRYLVVNGNQTDKGSKNTTAVTYYGFVPAGDVVLTVVGGGTMLNFTSIKFMKKAAPDHARDAAHGDSWMAPGELGTICLENGAIATGGDILELVGKNAEGKVVFATVSHMEPGKPYLFESKSNAMNFYYTDETPAENPVNTGAMKGSFIDYTLNDVENVYYFSGHALWRVSGDHLNVVAHRAYVKLDEVDELSSAAPAPGRRYITMNVHGQNQTTGIEDLMSGDAPMKVMIDGTLFILRDEKVFDATGRLVK